MSTTAKATTAAAAVLMMLIVFIASTTAALTAILPSWLATWPTTSPTTNPSQTALADIPGNYLADYEQAATACSGLDWSILAAIGKIESNHGRSTLPGVAPGTQNTAGAGGPMQQLQPTWNAILTRHRIPPGGATPPSRYNPHDAIWAAAFLLCDNGAARGDLRSAIFAYNHATWYVNQVLAQARRYSETTPNTSATCGTFQRSLQSSGADFSSAALVAARYACAQLGRPYVWGGNGAGGFDCSGLTKAAYAAAGITIPRTADQQYRASPRLAADEPLRPGDLVFYGDPRTRITHVALYVGANQVVQARDVGTLIEQDTLPRAGYAGASRPAAQNAGPR
jgi:cell wall-associated NlpC family hydrolase